MQLLSRAHLLEEHVCLHIAIRGLQLQGRAPNHAIVIPSCCECRLTPPQCARTRNRCAQHAPTWDHDQLEYYCAPAAPCNCDATGCCTVPPLEEAGKHPYTYTLQPLDRHKQLSNENEGNNTDRPQRPCAQRHFRNSELWIIITHA